MKLKDDEKLHREKTNFRVKCKCGHSVIMLPMEHRTRKICSYCGKWVYANKKEEFKDRLKERLRKKEN